MKHKLLSYVLKIFVGFLLYCNGNAADTPALVADIGLNPSSGYAPLSVQANGNASYSTSDNAIISNYEWHVSNGVDVSGAIQTFEFEQAGDYVITLVVVDSNGLRSAPCSLRISVFPSQIPQIDTNQAPVARIVVDKIEDIAPLSIVASALNSSDADGFIQRYLWRSSDGQISEGINANFNFAYAGQYNLNLLVLDDKGAVGSANQLLNVIPSNQNAGANLLPNALFSMNPSIGIAPQTISFDASASYDEDGQILDYYWFSSDGKQGGGISPAASFDYPGSYNITLRVTDDQGGIAYSSQTLNLSANSVNNPANQPPVADFTYSPTQSFPPMTVSLDASASLDADGQIVSYRWLSSDGQQARGVNSELSFNQTGIYSITLRVTDNQGSSSIKVGKVEVLAPITPAATGNLAPNAIFTITQDATDPFLALVDASAANDPDGLDSELDFAWSSSYGAKDTGINATFRLPDYGKYNISLAVTDVEGATSISSQFVEVLRDNSAPPKRPPVADFVILPSENGSVPATISLDASNAHDLDGTINSYLWSISDNRQLLGINPALTFSSVGRYSISLTVVDNDGLRSSISKSFNAYEAIDVPPPPPTPPVAIIDVNTDTNPPIPPIISTLLFNSIADSYRAGDNLVVELFEAPNSNRTEAVDLWAAIKTEDGRLLFLNNNSLAPFSTTAKALKTNIPRNERQQRLFAYQIPSGIIGRFELYAMYVALGGNPVSDSFTTLRSNILLTQLQLRN